MPDVNVLLNALKPDAEAHRAALDWLHATLAAGEPFALSDMVLQAFVRVATGRTFASPPVPVDFAFDFVERLINHPNCRVLTPGPNNWTIFKDLCTQSGVRGPKISDAAHAALAIEHGCEWVTFDTDFARFAPPLRWRLLG